MAWNNGHSPLDDMPAFGRLILPAELQHGPIGAVLTARRVKTRPRITGRLIRLGNIRSAGFRAQRQYLATQRNLPHTKERVGLWPARGSV